MKLNLAYYVQNDVVSIAKDLIGKILVSKINNQLTSGIIVETEAYNGVIDKASHAYNNRRTARTSTMYQQGGVAYIYLCYGIHHLFNVVTNVAETPHAVLIRALEPLAGIDYMLERRKKQQVDFSITKGPGALSQAMGFHKQMDGESLLGDTIWIEENKMRIEPDMISAGTRIGVDYAAEDANLPYRFWLTGNPYVSKMPHKK